MPACCGTSGASSRRRRGPPDAELDPLTRGMPDEARGRASDRSPAPAVELAHRILPHLEAVEAADVHRNRGLTVPPGPTGERLDPAGAAEQAVNVVLVEEVVGGRVFAALEAEPLGGDEGQQGPRPPAHRTVAAHCRGPGVQLHGVAHGPAVTASAPGLVLRHLDLQAAKLCIVAFEIQALAGLSSGGLPVRVPPP